jgi:hypothetical protein
MANDGGLSPFVVFNELDVDLGVGALGISSNIHSTFLNITSGFVMLQTDAIFFLLQCVLMHRYSCVQF